MVGEPLFARSDGHALGKQRGADRLSGGKSGQHAVLAAARDHGRGAAARGTLGCEYFGEHAAATEWRAGAARQRFERNIASARAAQQRGARIFARIGRIEPLLIGE